jgi:hypothetical protein
MAADIPTIDTVADGLTIAREEIVALTGIPANAIKLELKMGV